MSLVSTEQVPVYPIGWGWNSAGRAGNLTDDQVDKPRYVQQSAGNRFIGCAAGMHHSLLVSDNGTVFSFGDGRKGQLGYGNAFLSTDDTPLQMRPRQITPTGHLRGPRDMKYIEVGAGYEFSVAREASNEEGVDMCRGLRQLEEHLKSLLRLYRDSESIQRAWANVRQERYELSLSFGGQVVTWGTSRYGALGLSRYTYQPYCDAI